jgi:hypothetical protein
MKFKKCLSNYQRPYFKIRQVFSIFLQHLFLAAKYKQEKFTNLALTYCFKGKLSR